MMSHHFDTPSALEDPRINVCDMYLFSGRPGTTVMAMTVNPDAGISAPSSFREEGLYAFRIDLDGDQREEVAFKVRFGAVHHPDGDEHRHEQPFEVRRATGIGPLMGLEGDLIAAGSTGVATEGAGGVRFLAGLAPDLFAGDAVALGRFRKALFSDHSYDRSVFLNANNFFARRNVTAIVLEVPNALIGEGRISAWATASLYGHAPEVQVSRWGLPLITNFYMPDAEMKEHFNRAMPTDDQTTFIARVAEVTGEILSLAGAAERSAIYVKQLVARLFPTMLPYEIGTLARFDVSTFNGRALIDDAMDVILSLATNSHLSDGVAPDPTRTRAHFPYFGDPYSLSEQAELAPARPKRKLT
jgi:hypothetical protein